MTPRQAEIAAEAHVASQLARCGYDVLVQYGANQPDYDLVAIKDSKTMLVSVKGSQSGGWPLAVSKIKETKGCEGNRYHRAIDLWFEKQRKDVVFFFAQFLKAKISEPPRLYIARPAEIAKHLKMQWSGKGYAALHEDYGRDHPGSSHNHRIPDTWIFSAERLDEIAKGKKGGKARKKISKSTKSSVNQ